MSRNTQCTPENVESIVSTIINNLDDCLPFNAVCRRAGIHRDTYYGWVERAEKGEEPFASAVDRIECARFELQRTLTKRLQDFATNGTREHTIQFKATQFLIERLFPDGWYTPRRVEVSGPDGGPVSVRARVVMLPPLESDDGRSGNSVAPEPGAADKISR